MHTTFDREEKTRDYEVKFWAELVQQGLHGLKLSDVQAVSPSLDHLLKLFGEVRNLVTSYDPEVIRKEAEYEYDGPGEGKKKYQWNTYEVLLEQLRLLFTGMQRLLQFLMDAAMAEVEAGKGFATLEQLQQILVSKIQDAIFPAKKEHWVGGVRVEVTLSEFQKKGNRHLDIFLEGRAALKRSVEINFYDVTGETGAEKTMSFERLNKIRLDQIKFLKKLYGAPEKEVVSAEGQENLKLIRQMSGRKFRLHSDDDWRQFLLLKFHAVRGKVFSPAEALPPVVDILRAYLEIFTIHTDYNIYDSGPEIIWSENSPGLLPVN